jgi:hypothetical protein
MSWPLIDQSFLFMHGPAMLTRRVLAVILILSVASLPASASFAATQNAKSAISDLVDCHDKTQLPCHESSDGCVAMGSCALKCFALTGLDACYDCRSDWTSKLTALLFMDFVPLFSTAPPFHPPRA